MKKTEMPKYKDNVTAISYAGKNEEKRKAKQVLEEARKQEREQNFTPAKINSYTTILVKRGKDINRQVSRYKESMT